MTPPPLRERKAAQTRLALATALADALTSTPLSEVRVDELALAANVSRMTFFNYFPTKEAAVAWLFASWIYRLQARVHQQQAQGRAALLLIAHSFAEDLAGSRDGLLRLTTSQEVARAYPTLLQLSDADRWLLAPGLESLPPVESFGQLLTRASHEARERGEVQYEGSAFEFGLFLGAAMQGTLLVGRPEHGSSHAAQMLRHVHRILGLPLDDAAPPPQVPDPYTAETLTRSGT